MTALVRPVSLAPLDRAELSAFLRRQARDFGDAKVRAGQWTAAEAEERARREINVALATGGARHRFLKGVDAEGRVVGWVWTGPAPAGHPSEAVYLYQITVAEDHRGRGVGRALLTALEARLRAERVPELRLNVFLHNEVAIRLYLTSGYEVVDEDDVSARMAKRLAPAPPG